jgi:hypothetical protein
MSFKKRSRPTIAGKAEDKKAQGPLPEDGKSQATWKEKLERLGLKDQPVTGLTGEDDYFTNLESRRSRLKKALGIDDHAFCDGLLQQLNRLFPIDEGAKSEMDFSFVLSVLESPVDKDHAMLRFQMALVQLCITRQAQILLRPINYELPDDVAVALHQVNWDARRMEPQKIKIQDQPVRQVAERMVTRLMHTFALQFEISASYRKDHEQSVKGQQVYVSTSGQNLLTDGTKAAGRSSQQQNGYHHSAAGFTESSKPTNAVNVQKSNGHASS